MGKSQKTKEIILQKAMEVVAEKGYSASSTREIAEKAGVSEATLFKYYGTKEELLKSIVLKTIDEFHSYSMTHVFPKTFEKAQNQPAAFLLKEMVKERLAFFNENSPAIRVVLQEMMINKSVREMFKNKIWAEMVRVSDEIFNRGKAQGEFKTLDNYFLRKAVFGILFFDLISENIMGLEDDVKYNPEHKSHIIVEMMLKGILEE